MQTNEFYRVTTNHGQFTLELYPKQAPITVENFKHYVRTGHYVGTVFNRVISGFMIQGGGYTEDGTKKRTLAPIHNEATNGLMNVTKSVAMARHPEPHSATSQFFINLADNANLDHISRDDEEYGYAVFGTVSEGWDVIEKIAALGTIVRGADKNYPKIAVIIQKVEPL